MKTGVTSVIWPEQTSIENSVSEDQLFSPNNDKESKNYLANVKFSPSNDILANLNKKKEQKKEEEEEKRVKMNSKVK